MVQDPYSRCMPDLVAVVKPFIIITVYNGNVMAETKNTSNIAAKAIKRAVKTFLTPGVTQFDDFISELRKHCIVDIACMKVGLNTVVVRDRYEQGKTVLTDQVRLKELGYIANLADDVIVNALTDKSDHPIKNKDKPDILNIRLAYLWDQVVADKIGELLGIQTDMLTEDVLVKLEKVPAPKAGAYVRNKQILLENIRKVLSQIAPDTFTKETGSLKEQGQEVLVELLKTLGRGALKSPDNRAPMGKIDTEIITSGDAEVVTTRPTKRPPPLTLPKGVD